MKEIQRDRQKEGERERKRVKRDNTQSERNNIDIAIKVTRELSHYFSQVFIHNYPL